LPVVTGSTLHSPASRMPRKITMQCCRSTPSCPAPPHQTSNTEGETIIIIFINCNWVFTRWQWCIQKYILCLGGPGSSVGIATGYGLDGPGIESSGFGGLRVCVLASGTRDRGFAPDRSRRIFHNGKIRSTQSFGLSVFRLIPEQFQTNKVHDTSKIGH
jgi:hypothetical protein